jgi:hypothetical protein
MNGCKKGYEVVSVTNTTNLGAIILLKELKR